MKNKLYIGLLLITLLISSCAKDDGTDPNATSPTTDNRDALIGSWGVTENSTTSTTPNTYTVIIGKQSSTSSGIVIDNFYGLTTYSVSAVVTGNTFKIPYQSIKNNTNSTIGFAAGSGTLATSTKINITYTTSIAGGRDSCTATYTK